VEVAPADPDAWPRDPAQIEAKLTSLQNKITHNRDFLELTLPDPDPDAETLLISYGLADQAARKAVTLIRAAAARVSHLTLYSLWPIPRRAIRRALTHYVHRVLIPELNTGLYAAELAGIIKAVKIEPLLRFDGRLIDPQTIACQVTHWPCG
jgi:2-oxoglutarate ferredoxin oxidoreductase subunit alpha